MLRYELLETIGQGAMGVVHRAVHPDLKREVAIKFLSGDVKDLEPMIVTRFKREMSVLIGLSHPNIVKVFDAGEDDGKLFYVMELVRGLDLDRFVKEEGRLPLPRALRALDELLDALDLVHERGIVHRDIKPSNVMLDETGRAILMDFGVVRLEDASVLTAKGIMVGTPLYLSPQVMLGDDAMKPDDLWSLGVTMYEAIAGSAPFRALSLAELLTSVLNKDIPPLSSRCPDIPRPVEAFIHRLLEREPAKRWPSAREARQELARITTELAIETQLDPGDAAPDASRTTRKIRGTRRRTGTVPTRGRLSPLLARVLPRAGAILGLGLVVGLVLVWLGSWRSGSSSGPLQVEGLSLRYEALDRFVVDFRTREPEQLELGWKGNSIAETAPLCRHRFELPVSPFEPIENLSARRGSRSLELQPPLCPGERVNRLAQAVRTCRLDEELVDRVWIELKQGLVKHVREISVEAVAECVRDHPDVATPLERVATRMRSMLGEQAEAVRPFVGALMMSSDTPDVVRDELLFSLRRIDLLDALANYLGRPPVFDVQRMLAPSLETAVTPIGTSSAPARSVTVRAFPEKGGPGIILLPPKELTAPEKDWLAALGGLIVGAKRRLAALVPASRFSFEMPVESPLDVKRLHVRTHNFGSQIHLLLAPPGWKEPVPVRLPDGARLPGNATVWITIELRGASARVPGRWTCTQGRAFRSTDRWFFSIEEVLVETGR